MSDWQELGDGVFTKRYEFADQQIGVIIGAGGAVLIDTRSSHRQAEEIRRDLQALTPLPVTTVINTHGHSDHCFGNHPFRPAPIWGHVRCVAMIERTGERQREALTRSIPEMADEFAEVVMDPPDRVFDTETTVELAGRVLTMRHLGRGHTDNDIVVLVPRGLKVCTPEPDSVRMLWGHFGNRFFDRPDQPAARGLLELLAGHKKGVEAPRGDDRGASGRRPGPSRPFW